MHHPCSGFLGDLSFSRPALPDKSGSVSASCAILNVKRDFCRSLKDFQKQIKFIRGEWVFVSFFFLKISVNDLFLK